MSEKRDAYVARLKAQLDEWNLELDKLQARVDRARADSRVRYQQRIEKLRKQRGEAQARLAELQESGENAWEDLKEGVEKAWSALSRAIKKARKEFE